MQKTLSFPISSQYLIQILNQIDSTIKKSRDCNMYGSFKKIADNICIDW